MKQTNQFIEQVAQNYQRSLSEARFSYQVTYCDTKYFHRFTNFEVQKERADEIKTMLEEFIEELKKESKGILMSKV